MPWNNPTVWNGSSSCIYYIKLFLRRDRQIIKVAINLTNWSFQSWIFCMCSPHLLAPPFRAWSGFGVASTTRNDCVTPRNRSCAEMLKIFKQMKCNKMGGNQKNKGVIVLTTPKSFRFAFVYRLTFQGLPITQNSLFMETPAGGSTGLFEQCINSCIQWC